MYNEIEMVRADKPEEDCGVFGVYAPGQDVVGMTYLGLFALQHRGQESAGIAVSDGNDVIMHKDMGLVSQVFTEKKLQEMKGHMATGHVRYSTTGSSQAVNASPLVARYRHGFLALSHNGNLLNALKIRKELEDKGHLFQTTIDSEVIASLIAQIDRGDVEAAIADCMKQIKGAYALVIMTRDKLFGVRDPRGIRPLSIGRLPEGGYVLSSETCGLDIVGAEFVDDVQPGEIVRIDSEGLHRRSHKNGERKALCVFEFVYFARPDSDIDGSNVYLTRRRFGAQLAREHPVEADLVIPVPDSGISAAIGYAEEAGIPYAEGLIKNRYIGRTFIQPSQNMRETSVKIKLNPIRKVLAGKRVVVIDDSIVRGTTSAKIVQMIREAGAAEVHMRITSPPVRFPCHFGIDTQTSAELIANSHTPAEIKNIIGADSLGYLSLEGLYGVSGLKIDDHCSACFDGAYPIPVDHVDYDKMQLEREFAVEEME